jgi:hypothetical protein
LAGELKLKIHALWDVLAAGVALGVINVRKVWTGGPGGRKPNVVSLNADGLSALALKAKSGNDAFANLPKSNRRILERADLRKSGLASQQQLWNLARLCAAVGSDKVLSYAELAGELQLSSSMVSNLVRAGRAIGVLKTQRRHGTNGRSPNRLTIDWKRWQSFAKSRSDRTSDLRPASRNGTRPLRPGERSSERAAQLESVDWRRLGIPTEHQWRNLVALITAIGDGRRVSFLELSRELQTSVRTVENTARLARESGVVRTMRSYDRGSVGPRTDWAVVWERVCPRGGRPTKWDEICEWVSDYRGKNRSSTLQAARAAYRSEFPNRPLPTLAQLKAAMYARRKG